MASRKAGQRMSDPLDAAPASCVPSPRRPDDVTEELQSHAGASAAKCQKAGKFRRTALTFFGVRKSICILPNFFGGRSKNPSKWPTKKGLCKSRTHDGLCKLSQDESPRSGFPVADLEFHHQRDPELQSGARHECSLPSAEQRSQSLTRQKRGLKGLFQSFRHHKTHRNSGAEKMAEMTLPDCQTAVPVAPDNGEPSVTECLRPQPDVPDTQTSPAGSPLGSQHACTGAELLEESVEQESPKSEPDGHATDERTEELGLMVAVSGEFGDSSRGYSEPCLLLQMIPEPSQKTETPAGSSDQLNLIYGEVASLKSFDSLTGCGDIIADQEDDSIAESATSGERSRNGGKRASCYLTYQGGGEEMASPEDLDEQCLRDFWGNEGGEDVCCSCDRDNANPTCSHNMDLLNSNSARPTVTADTSSSADVLTPQSEHQESVPNSDEGYYDSTTPGPEDSQEKADRLPRDSYSGDALYELFAPDESLLSPRSEGRAKVQGSAAGEAPRPDAAFVPDINRLQIASELYGVDGFPEVAGKAGAARSPVGPQDADWKKNSNLNRNSMDLDEKGDTSTSVGSANGDGEQRLSSESLDSTSDPESERLCESEELRLQENAPTVLGNLNSQAPGVNGALDDVHTVCFSQALVDYTKNSMMLSNLHNSVAGLETNSTFTPNMRALPAIVTFDVVDMHNEGEYDEQIHMELEEDISSPYQEFEESYLQKDAFAECDYQMLDLYEQSLVGGPWAISSLPRHLGLGQPLGGTLALDRRSRSLDTESPEASLPDTYGENVIPCSRDDTGSNRDSYFKKNVLPSELGGSGGSGVALSWQARSEVALSLSLADGEVRGLNRNPLRMFPSSPGGPFLSASPPDVSERASGDAVAAAELYGRQIHIPLQADPCLPLGSFLFAGEAAGGGPPAKAASYQGYGPGGQQVASKEGTPPSRPQPPSQDHR